MIAYQLYAELEDYKPKIWRRFCVNKNISLANLGYIVMTLYEMKASHLLSIDYVMHPLTPSGKLSKRTEIMGRYGFPSNELDSDDYDMEDATKIKLSSLDLETPYRLIVCYDYGDDWRVMVKLEKEIEMADLSPKELPHVIEGKGFGILEDCGGVYALMDLAENKGEKSQEYGAAIGVKDFDLAKFDINDMNFRLRKLPAIFAKIYEQHSIPSQRSIDLIERKYLK